MSLSAVKYLIDRLMLICCVLLLFSGAISTVFAEPAEDFTIAYLQMSNDGRYSKKRTYARFLLQPLGRPYSGALVAMDEIKFHGAGLGVKFKLTREKGKNTEQLSAIIERFLGQGVHFFVLDAPADTVAELALKNKGKDLILFNISAPEDRLRQAECQRNLLHIYPSYAMQMDALMQYLIFRKWNRVLVLEGPLEEDRLLTLAFARSAKRYGAKIVAQRTFLLSNDPRERDRNNVALLTADADYDVVFVADTDGEFARAVPYQTIRPQLVVGSEGLGALAWHWAWERHGAPQLENRFEEKTKRPMTSSDWAAWLAVKAVAESVQRTQSSDFVKLRDYLLSQDAILDGFKGNRLNFRPWNHQLRQPMLLATHNWVVDRAPLRGFQHQINHMDLLGFDERETLCEF